MLMRRVRFMVRLTSFVTAMAVALPVIGRCQAPESWVGKRVITKFGTVFEPKPGDPTDAQGDRIGSRHRVPGEREKLWVYRVEQATGQWLQLVAENEEESGWVTADRVVPLDQAIENLNDDIRAHPTAENYNNRGLLWTAKGSYDRAITDISEAIRLKPNYGPAYNNRGLAWFSKGNYDAAIRDFGRAIKVEPTFASAYSNRAVAWSKKREPDKAIADYTEAIRINPRFARAYCNRAVSWFERGDPDKAFADFNEAIRLEPKSASAYRSRATAWSAKGEYEKALADFSEAIRIEPKNAATYRRRGDMWYAKQEDERAIADYTAAIGVDSKDSQAFRSRGVALSRAGMRTRHLPTSTRPFAWSRIT